MFGGFTTRPNFGNQLFPSRTLGQFGNVSNQIAAAFLQASGITDATISAAISQLVADLTFYGILSKFYAIYPFVGSTAAQQKYNLINPADNDAAYRLNFVGGWTHSANGALPNGVNSYADTFLIPSTTLLLNSHSFGIYSRTNSLGGSQAYGVFQTPPTHFLQNNLANGNFVSGGLTNVLSYTANPSTSLLMASRTSNTLFTAYRAGVSLGTNTAAISTIPTTNFYLGARNTSSIPDSYTVHQLAFAFFASGLNSTEAANLYTAVQAFQTTLSRQV